jgi:hypothetical protein
VIRIPEYREVREQDIRLEQPVYQVTRLPEYREVREQILRIKLKDAGTR